MLRPNWASFCFSDQLHYPPPRPHTLWEEVVPVPPSLAGPLDAGRMEEARLPGKQGWHHSQQLE